MREMVAPFYWAAAGALAGCGLIGLMTIGWPFLLAGAFLALVGLILLRTKGIWALFVGLGGCRRSSGVAVGRLVRRTGRSAASSS